MAQELEPKDQIRILQAKISSLEKEIESLRRGSFRVQEERTTVRVPDPIKELFDLAQDTVRKYFLDFHPQPWKGTIEISGQRYVLLRASALSFDFLNTIRGLYGDRGDNEAIRIGKNLLFDIAHVIGMNDARNFHQKMGVRDPIAKLSAGPVHFAFTGWAFVDIMPQSHPTPDADYFLYYHHPFSFEADSWLRAGEEINTPVCIMNAGYSSGWCEESFGMPLTAVEISCRARGDENCTFVMAPPDRIRKYVEDHLEKIPEDIKKTVVYDIPTFLQRKQAEEQLNLAKQRAEESDRLKSLFLASMSHEIRTPLNAVLGSIDLIWDENPSAEIREHLETISFSGTVLMKLINDILDFSKIEANELQIQQTASELAPIFIRLQSSFSHIIEHSDKPITLSYSLPSELMTKILIDPTRLQQVLTNLLENAVKFTEKGSIDFGVQLEGGDSLCFYVRDSGIGIPPEKLGTIFKTFQQLDSTTTRKYGGSGLGLAIAKRIVELMSGTIRVTSEPGQGSEFSFLLPYLPVETQDLETHGEQPEDSSGTIQTILLVEDDETNLKVAQMILDKSGYSVISARNGNEAVSIFEENRDVDLVIMDVGMPVMDGLQAVRKMREIEEHSQLTRKPVIALTAHAFKEDRERCLSAGFDEYLTKPIDRKKLIDTVRRFHCRDL